MKTLVTVTSLNQISIDFQFNYFDLILINIDKFHHASITAQFRQIDFNWLKIHHNHCFQVKHENINSTIIGGLIVAGLTPYTKI